MTVHTNISIFYCMYNFFVYFYLLYIHFFLFYCTYLLFYCTYFFLFYCTCFFLLSSRLLNVGHWREPVLTARKVALETEILDCFSRISIISWTPLFHRLPTDKWICIMSIVLSQAMTYHDVRGFYQPYIIIELLL